MAKKTLTPEQAEIKAMKKAKSSQNWTKFWAIVLAGALAFGIVAMGQNQAKVALENATANSGEIADDNNNDVIDDSDDVVFDDNTSNDNVSNDNVSNDNTSNDNAANNNSSNNNNTSDNTGNNSQQSAQVSNADVAKALNEATAKAAKASYSFERTAQFTKNIDVGGLTGILDGIIKGVDENSDLNSVVGGFLGIKKDPIKGEVKNGAGEGFDAKYMIKAMNLTEADIQKAQVNGNTYQVQIKTCTNPDENSAWAHASNDYITFKEVNESIAGAVGSAVKVEESGSQATYKNILIVAVIENGNLTSLKYSYTFDATIKIKAGLTATGTGAAKMENTFSNFKY